MSPRRSPVLALLATLVSAAAIAGCGDGAEQVSAEELVERADRICSQLQTRFDEIQAEPLTSAVVGEEQADELLDVTEDAQSELRDLEPPEEIRDPYDRYLDSRDDVADLLEEGRDAARSKDGAAYGRAQEDAAAGARERRRLARQLGFKVCSQGTSAS